MKWLSTKTQVLRKLRRDNGGSTVVEFALIGPVFLILLIGIFEVGMILISQNAIDVAARSASRYGITGNGGIVTARAATIKALAQKYSFGILDPAKMIISATTYASVSNLNAGISGYGVGNSIVLYSITYSWKLVTPLVGKAMGLTNGIMPLQATQIVMNEPFLS